MTTQTNSNKKTALYGAAGLLVLAGFLLLVGGGGGGGGGPRLLLRRAEEDGAGNDNDRQLLSLLHKQDPRTIQAKEAPVAPSSDGGTTGTIVAVLNTPKSGTGTLTSHFYKSFHCPCPDGKNAVFRSHTLQEGAAHLAKMRKKYPNHRCVITTAIRDPRTWIPSWFMETHKNEYCLRKGVKPMETARLMQEYRRWLGDKSNNIRAVVGIIRPKLLTEFGAPNVRAEFDKMNANGGYTHLVHSGGDENNVYAGCELLFLRMEDSDAWPNILSQHVPGTETVIEVQGARMDRCPGVTKDQYKALLEYELTKEEKERIIAGDEYTIEYFDLYGQLPA